MVRIVSIYPANDKVGEMRSLLEGRMSFAPGTSLSIGVLGEMATFVHTTVFDSLEAYEKVRDTESADSSISQHRGRIGSLLRAAPLQRLMEIIVPANG